MSEQSTSALERDAERTRADISDTTDQLKSKDVSGSDDGRSHRLSEGR